VSPDPVVGAAENAVRRYYGRWHARRVTSQVPPSDIRFITGDAWETWRDIRLRALQDAPNAFGSTHERELAFTESDFRKRLDGPDPSVIAFVAGEPVGMGAGFQDAEGWLHVVAMWVDPRSRGHGVGGLVLNELVNWAGEHGLRAHLDVASDNSAARRFYERHGFVATGETSPLRPGSNHTIERMDLPGRRDGLRRG